MDESLSYSTVKKWIVELRRGKGGVDDYKRSGRPKEVTTDENIELVHNLIMSDRRRILLGIAR